MRRLSQVLEAFVVPSYAALALAVGCSQQDPVLDRPLAPPAWDAGEAGPPPEVEPPGPPPPDASAPVPPQTGDAGAAPPEPAWGSAAAPSSCAECHPEHVRQWSMSPHAYAAVDPVFRAMIKLGQRATDGALGEFCVRCHSPYAVLTGQAPVVEGPEGMDQPLEGFGPIARAGVSCDVCHAAVSTGGERLLSLDRGPTRRAGIASPVPNDSHPSELGPLQRTSSLCGACHDVELDGLLIERTMTEWLTVAGPSGPCNGCHMPTRIAPAAVDGPDRRVHDHTFAGVDVSLLPPSAFPGYEELRARSRALLQRQSVTTRVEVDAAAGILEVRVRNLAGHALPSGATSDRQLWIEVQVWDESDQQVFATGTLDARGDLRTDDPAHTLEPGSDPQLAVFHQRLFAEEEPGLTKVHFAWQARSLEERLIPPLGSVEVRYELPALRAGNYRARVRLRIRAFPPYLLRLLEREAGLDPDVAARMPIVDMASHTLSFQVP